MAPPRPELRDLLRTLDPQAPLAERHLWLMQLLDWVRGHTQDPDMAVARVRATWAEMFWRRTDAR